MLFRSDIVLGPWPDRKPITTLSIIGRVFGSADSDGDGRQWYISGGCRPAARRERHEADWPCPESVRPISGMAMVHGGAPPPPPPRFERTDSETLARRTDAYARPLAARTSVPAETPRRSCGACVCVSVTQVLRLSVRHCARCMTTTERAIQEFTGQCST